MHYKIYELGSEGHITMGHDVHCPTDSEAFDEIAHIVGSSQAAELWCGTRRVGRWEPVDTGPPPPIGPELKPRSRDAMSEFSA